MHIKHYITAFLVSATCLFGSALPSHAADTDNHFQVGSLHVERHGKQGTPIVLIPGLASGAWVWEGTVKQLEKNHTLYVVTLAGFDGQPATEGPLLEKAKTSLLELIQQQKLDKPVLLGHSMGGTLAIWFAQQHSELIRGVIAVDGLPVFPGTEHTPANQRPALAARFKTQMTAQTPEIFAARQLQYMRTIGVIDEQLAQKLAAQTGKSDPAATADYVSEIVSMDLRKDMTKVLVPLLEISPYYTADFAARNISLEAKNAYYQSLLQGAPKLQVVAINNARHFTMFDQPQAFNEAISNFLKTVE